MTVAYVLDDVFASHRPPSTHPERPERYLAVRDALRGSDLPAHGQQLPIRAATDEELGRVHTAGYLDLLEREVAGKRGWLDADTYFSEETFTAARAAAGAAVDVALTVLDGRADSAIAIVRPPGHHAEADQAMGFCLYNNVAVAAAAARAAGAARVAIVDWDVHHGNGTQHMFWTDPTVLYLSSHQWPFYPGTGAPGEVGAGAGAGTTINAALPAGSTDADYAAVFDDLFVPELLAFRPDLILVSAGFDAYVDDPLAEMRVTERGYRYLADALNRAATTACAGRIAYVLEGGYDLDGLRRGWGQVLESLSAAPAGASSFGEARPVARTAIDKTRAALAAVRGKAA
jgi:acetoin utilization deacetylase AcuC-like enzyme